MLDCLASTSKTLTLSKTSFGLPLLMYTSELNSCTIMMSHLLLQFILCIAFSTFLSTHMLMKMYFIMQVNSL